MINKVFNKIVLCLLLLFCSNAFATVYEINTGESPTSASLSLTVNDSINFIGTDGTLTISAASENVGLVSTNNNGVGILSFSNAISGLDVSGDIGSLENKIDKITASADFTTLNFSNNIYTVNGIVNDTNNHFKIVADGSQNQLIDSSIGTATEALKEIQISNTSGDVTFSGSDLFTNVLTIDSNAVAIVSSTGSVNLGDLANNGSLTINNDVTIGDITGSGYFKIADGKVATIVDIGDVTFSTGDSLNIEVDDRASDAQFKFTGGNTINVNDGTSISFDYVNGSSVSVGSTYDFLTTTGTLATDNALSGVSVTDNSFLLDPAISIVGSALRVTNNLDTSSTALLKSDDLELLNNIISLESVGGNMSLLNSGLLSSTSQASFEEALDTVDGADNNMTAISSINISNRIDDIINSRIASIKINKKRGFSSGNKNKSIIIRNNIWGQVFAGSADQETISNEDGYKTNTSGLVFGADVALQRPRGAESILGVALSYGMADVEDKSVSEQETDISSYHVSFYNSNFLNRSKLGLYNDNIINIAYNQYDSSRKIVTQMTTLEADASYSAMQYGLKTGLGYNIKILDTFLFAPNASIKYSILDQGKYQETGAGNAGLIVDSESFDMLVSDVGFKVMGRTFDIFRKAILPELSLSWSRNLITDGQKATAQFISGGDTFKSTGVDLEDNFFNAGLSVNTKISADTSIIVDYDFQSSSTFKSHTGYLKYRISF